MAFDRFITWQKRRPTPKDIGFILEDFLGGAAIVEWEPTQSRYSALLRGEAKDPFGRVDLGFTPRPSVESDPDRERWIEVVVDSGPTADVITRRADPYTNAVATAFAKLLAWAYEAKLEMG